MGSNVNWSAVWQSIKDTWIPLFGWIIIVIIIILIIYFLRKKKK